MAGISNESRIAANRFGLGLRPDESEALVHPRAWLEKQLQPPFSDAIMADTSTLYSTILAKARGEDREAKKAAQQALREAFRGMLASRFKHAITSRASFRERLVWFWSNHFSVSGKNPASFAALLTYEAQAIRPHILGHFEDLLIAVAQHPAMLVYLDNVRSSGIDSLLGKRRGAGLNENLAREILELHTLGVQGGYTQDDIIALAKLITGWSVEPDSGSFRFRPAMHSRETVTLLNKRYAGGTPDKARGEQALRDIARHPSTARFICTKLARHFISDIPPSEAIDALTISFQRNHGDLNALYQTLLNLPQAWAAGQPKLKSSPELIVSAARLANAGQDLPQRYLGFSVQELGNTPFTAPSPAGFPDTAEEALGSDMLLRRIQWAQMAARMLTMRNASLLPPDTAAYLAFGKTMPPEVNAVVVDAGSREKAYAMLFASPSFQWR